MGQRKRWARVGSVWIGAECEMSEGARAVAGSVGARGMLRSAVRRQEAYRAAETFETEAEAETEREMYGYART